MTRTTPQRTNPLRRPVSLVCACMIALSGAQLIGCGGGGGGGPRNQSPTAAFEVLPPSGLAPLVVVFDASASTDADGSIASYEWSFADGGTATGVTVQHTYAAPGRFEARLTVADDDGATDSETQAVIASMATAATRYTVTLVPKLPGGGYIEPRDVNNKGEVVGFATDDQERSRAFLYTGGATRSLGTLGGPTSYARAINDAGEVVGVADLATGVPRAFRYSAGAMRELGTLGGFFSEASDINNRGQVVGRSDDKDGRILGFLYEGGQMKSLGDLFGGGYSPAECINGVGLIAGEARVDGELHAYIHASGVATDIGTLGGAEAWVSGCNDLGDVIGYSREAVAGPVVGFLYRNSLMQPLVETYSEPIAVNNAGVVVGYAHFGLLGHAFAWDEVNGLQDLNDLVDKQLGYTIQVAQGINDVGQIVAHGQLIGGESVGFLLTPASYSPVP